MKNDKKTSSKAVVEGRLSEYEGKKRRTLWRLLSNIRFQIPLACLAGLLTVLSSLVPVVKPYILKMVIDQNLETDFPNIDKIAWLSIIYFIVVIAGVLCDYFQQITLAALGQRIMHRMRTNLFAHIQSMNMTFFDQNSSGRLLTRINSDVESLSDLFSGIIIQFIKDILLIVELMAAMLILDVEIALWSFLCIPVVAGITFLYRYLSRRNFIKLKAQLSHLNGFLAENITGMKMVQIYCRENTKNEEYKELGKEYFRLGIVELTLNSLSHPLLNMLSRLSIAYVLMIFGPKVFGGSVEIGTLYAFVEYIQQLFNPIANLAEQFTSIQSALISGDRIYDIMDKKDTLEDLEAGRELVNFNGRIEFKNVWFAYVGENWVLKDVSFKVEPGERVAFVGSTGSGKSTIISLLARFYEIQKGQILLDGVDIREYNLTSLRRAISVVQQDVFMFTGDINYNIRLNEESITDEDIVSAIKTVNADGFINSLPNGLNTHVAERGTEFSAGQRQLVAFARAVAVKPSVLVLDEATASIDTETEAALAKAMESVSKDNTTITIAHRLATIVGYDKINVLDHGKIIERGRHEELIALGGRYAELYEMSLTSEMERKKSNN
ncbi:MAG: ABC transporter ATP-binding protein [Oscillospiraceae bacterium]|nr:ABC transporter ATP-binding protein [Oscillospiraceae bacterium]